MCFRRQRNGVIEMVVSRLESTDRTGVLIDAQNDDYPASELGYAIRAIERASGPRR